MSIRNQICTVKLKLMRIESVGDGGEKGNDDDDDDDDRFR